jgi:hypothetical protein
LSKTPFEGATTVIDAAVNPKHHGSRDCYFADLKEIQPSNDAKLVHLTIERHFLSVHDQYEWILI